MVPVLFGGRFFARIFGVGILDRINMINRIGVGVRLTVGEIRIKSKIRIKTAQTERLLGEGETGFGGLFAEFVHRDFVLKFCEVEFHTLIAESDARGEIGQALEREELVGCVVGFGDANVGGGHDGVVDFFRGGDVSLSDGVERRDGEFFSGGKVGVDLLDRFGLLPKAFQRTIAEKIEAEAAFGTWLVHTQADRGVSLLIERVDELIHLGVGEGGEGGLATLFSHKTVVEKGGIKGLGRKMGDGRWARKIFTRRHPGRKEGKNRKPRRIRSGGVSVNP